MRPRGMEKWGLARQAYVLLEVGFFLLMMGVAGLAQSSGDGRRPFFVTLSGRMISVSPWVRDREPVADVRLGTDSFTVPAGFNGGTQRVPDTGVAIHVVDEYLFVDSNNGGNGFRSAKSNIFAIRGGHLVHLGDVATDLPDELAALQRRMLHSGRFLDIDNQLENNRLTSHAEAPAILVAVEESSGGLIYDPTSCWALNSAAYRDEARKVAIGQATTSGFLFLAAIDKYCSRGTDLEHDLRAARRQLAGDRYSKLVSLLRSLQVGRRPTR